MVFISLTLAINYVCNLAQTVLSGNTDAVKAKDAKAVSREHTTKENLAIIEKRGIYFPKCLYHAFKTPFFVEKADAHFYYSPDGEKNIDLYNNVCHLGHSDPHVLRAVTEVYSKININTRYLTSSLTDYATHLQNYIPKGFKILFTNSGSEANDLALQIAMAALARDSNYSIGAFEKSYHGTTFLCQQASHLTPTGVVQSLKKQINLHFFPPDNDSSAALGAMPDVKAFILESIQGVGGNIEISKAWMQAIRKQVDVMICDEVQTGFGRSGGTFWAFEKAGIVPDIITCGKPIANGYPMGACIFRAELESFLPPFYFNTFGGNSAACAVAKVVLEQIEEKGIVRHSEVMGAFLKERLLVLGDKIDKVTGTGLFLGVHFRKDVDVKEVVEKLKAKKIIVGIGYNDVLRIKPPMTVDRATLAHFVGILRTIVSESTKELK